MGTRIIPKGDLRMCGIGFRVTWPPSKAVRSPPIFAARACEASWHVVENRKTMYQMTPKARSGVCMVAISDAGCGLYLEPAGKRRGLYFYTERFP